MTNEDPRGTLPAVLPGYAENGLTRHGVTTSFVIHANGIAGTTLDAQSAACAWRTPDRSRQEPLHDFVRAGLSRLEASLE